MIKIQTLDMMICQFLGEMLHSTWQLIASALSAVSAVFSYQAEHGIPPKDRQIIMSEV